MTRIRKALITAFGDESNITVVDADVAAPAAGEVQIAVEYSSFGGADVNMRKGKYPLQRKAPLTPGYSIVGTVHANGAGCARFAIGDRVACLTVYDGQAELANVPEAFVLAVPRTVDARQAVALINEWVTAYQMVMRAARVKSGDRVFVHGLSGAVGQAIVAIAKRQGADVSGTASIRNHDVLKVQGVMPFVYTDKRWIGAMQRLGGVDAVFDPLGFESFDESEAILRRGGILVAYGMNGPGFAQQLPPRHFLVEFLRVFAKNLKVWSGKRATFFGVNRKSTHYLDDLRTLLKWLERGEIAVPIKREFELGAIREAHVAWAKDPGMGATVIRVGAVTPASSSSAPTRWPADFSRAR
jgi:synaptic vesicle membrane protein VAT-1